MAVAEDLKNKFRDILTTNGIKDNIAEVILSQPDNLKGEYTASVVETIKVIFENGKDPLDLFVKKRLPPLQDEKAEAQMTQVILNEGKFLVEFVKEMQNFWEEREGSSNYIAEMFPRTYFVDEQVIIMDNLMKQGYVVLPKKHKLDVEHSKTVLENLAKFHAVTYVMIENAGGKDKFLEKHPNFEETFVTKDNFGMITQSFEPSYEMSIEVIKRSNQEGKESTYDFLQAFQGKLAQTFFDCLEAESFLTTVCHGDCWNNNIMFNPNHDKVVFLDFQLARLGSPSLDLAHFLYLSGNPEVFQHSTELLEFYFNKLQDNVLKLGQSFTFTFEDFLKDFGRKSTMSFLFGIFLVIGYDAISAMDQSDLTDFSTQFNDLLSKWILENEDKLETSSAAMIALNNHYLKFLPTD